MFSAYNPLVRLKGRKHLPVCMFILFLGVICLVLAISSECEGGNRVVLQDDFTGPDDSVPNQNLWELVTFPGDSIKINNTELLMSSSSETWPVVRTKNHFPIRNITMLVEWSPRTPSYRTLSIAIKSESSTKKLNLFVGYDNWRDWFINYSLNDKNYEIQAPPHILPAAENWWYKINITIRMNHYIVTIRARWNNSLIWQETGTLDPLGEDNWIALGIHNAIARYDNFTLYDLNNYPPVWDSIPLINATEDVIEAYDFSRNISDLNDNLSELRILPDPDSPYVHKVDGMKIEYLFPNGVLSATIPHVLTDGEFNVTAYVNFSIEPVNDPPHIREIPIQEILEESPIPYVLDLAQFIYDIDNEPSELTIFCEYPSLINLSGFNLQLEYSAWVPDHNITFWVSDGTNTTYGSFRVSVIPSEDPPIVQSIPDCEFIEDETKTIDISDFITDEDTPMSGLVIVMEHSALVEINELNLTFLFTDEPPDHTIAFTVTDGRWPTPGSFNVTIIPVNDRPHIIPFGVPIKMHEGSERWLTVEVEDEEDTAFVFDIDTTWSGLTVYSNGSLSVIAQNGEVGTYAGMLIATDGGGSNDTFNITVHVLNVNDPPDRPIILLPENGTVFYIGDTVDFQATVSDPDVVLGQVLSVTWTSSISRTLHKGDTAGAVNFTRVMRTPGEHTIRIKVSDEEYEAESSIVLQVREKGDGDDDPAPDILGQLLIPILIAVIIVILLVSYYIRSRSVRRAPGPSKTKEREGQVPPPPDPNEVSAVMEALLQHPGDLPSSLWGKEIEDVATEIAQAPKRKTEDGTTLVGLNGSWYIAGIEDQERFLQEWRE